MKTLLKKTCLSVICLLAAANTMAYDFEYDGCYFDILIETPKKECEITYKKQYEETETYIGNFVIPDHVYYKNECYMVTSIGEEAFRGCSRLTSVYIPESVTYIGSYAFYGCSNLTKISIPESVDIIGFMAFYGCSSLTGINIPESVIYIDDNAFRGCSSLTEINIPESVTSIGKNAFSGCSGLTEISIPESVTEIGSGAFSGCSGLTEINIPKSITKISGAMFFCCSGLTEINIPKNVTEIGEIAFYNCSSLTSINIPECVTKIGDEAFRGCSNLTSINIPKSVTEIGEQAFYKCSSLMSINIPKGVKTIGRSAFMFCSSLTSISIPNTMETMSLFAVNDCYNLLEYNIEDGTTPLTLELKLAPYRAVNINNVFKDLYIGRSINIEISATDDYYFINDKPYVGKPTGVEKITFSRFVTSVDDIGAHLASNLKTVIAHGQTPPVIADDFFSIAQYKNTMLYVPEGASDKYKKAQGWQNFCNIVEEKLPTGISQTESQAKMNVTAEDGGIMVRNAKGAIQVYTSTGLLIKNTTANGDVKITVPDNGVYIVKAGGETVKIAL